MKIKYNSYFIHDYFLIKSLKGIDLQLINFLPCRRQSFVLSMCADTVVIELQDTKWIRFSSNVRRT